MDRRWQARGRRRVRPAGAKPGAVVPTKFQIETAPKKSRDAKLLKLADKVSNLRSVALHPPSHWPDKRRREYVAWASAVAASLVGVSAPSIRHAGL